jgi:hypothetical protein
MPIKIANATPIMLLSVPSQFGVPFLVVDALFVVRSANLEPALALLAGFTLRLFSTEDNLVYKPPSTVGSYFEPFFCCNRHNT